jgi:hypothetical protein
VPSGLIVANEHVGGGGQPFLLLELFLGDSFGAGGGLESNIPVLVDAVGVFLPGFVHGSGVFFAEPPPEKVESSGYHKNNSEYKSEFNSLKLTCNQLS